MARSNFSIYAALASNIVIAVAKFIAGGFTRSAAMISEAVHSLVDCINELLLLLGIYLSNKEKDKEHPFGYGRELYFWSFIVAILIFGLGSGVSIYQGIVKLKNPRLTENLQWNFIVLAFSLLCEGISFFIALKNFNKSRGSQSLWEAIRDSKDPSSFMVLLEDGGAVIGVLIVALSLFLEQQTRNPYFDGAASLVVGLLLSFISIILARESRSLLMGEGISEKTEREIVQIVKKNDTVINVERFFSRYQSPDEVLVVLIISFKEHLNISDINEAISKIKQSIRMRFKKIDSIIIQPETEMKKADTFSG